MPTAPSRKKLPAPIAATGTSTIHREVIGDEYVRDLANIQQRMRVYTKMRRGDGAVNTSLLAIEKPIMGGRWEVAGEGEIVEACKAELFANDRGDPWDPPLLEQVLEQLLGMFQYGFAACEPFWELGDDGRVHCSRLTLIRQESVRTFRLDDTGKLLELVQQTSSFDTGWKEIKVPVDRLLLAVHAREGSDYSGVAIIRSSYRPFIERDTIRKARLWHHDRFGAGTPVAVYPERCDDTRKSEIDSALENWRAGASTYIAVPFGTVIEVKGGDGSGYDPSPELSALASEIAKNTLSQLTELGTAGNAGNRALGESFAEILRNSLQGYAERLAKIVRRQLMTPFVRWNFGESAEVPELTVRVTLAGVSELLNAVTLAVGAGLKLEPEDIAALRDELELPEIELEELTRRIEDRKKEAIEAAKAAPPGGDRKFSEPTTDSAGLFICRPVENADQLRKWFAGEPAFAGKKLDDDLHVTQLYSLTTVAVRPEWEELRARVTASGVLGHDGKPKGFVLFLEAPGMTERWNALRDAGAEVTYDSFRPHVTLFYLDEGEQPPTDLSIPQFDIVLGSECFEPLKPKTLSEPEAPPVDALPADVMPDYLGRMRPAKVVALEQRFVKPKLLSDLLDREAVRATADVHDVLREIDASLVEQVRDLAQQGGDVLVQRIADVSAPPSLIKRLNKAIAGAATRASTIGRDSVRAELERQGLSLATAPITRRTSLMERLFAPLVALADPDLYGGLAAFLKMLIELTTEREVSDRELGARTSAMAAASSAATEGAIDYLELAKRVQSDLEDRSIGMVENRVTQVLNVSFGQGRTETGELFGQAIETDIRTAVLDGSTCDHCAEHDGDEYEHGDPSAPDLPDPDCEGRWQCRCFYFFALAQEAA